jgi:hypothetical protein
MEIVSVAVVRLSAGRSAIMLTSAMLAAIGMALYQPLMLMMFPAGSALAAASKRAQTLAQESSLGVSLSSFEKSILLAMILTLL